jgi:hypothetical protein
LELTTPAKLKTSPGMPRVLPVACCLAIDETSPAFNSGVGGAEIPPTDARGQPRIDAVDRGSYEFDSMDLVFRNGFEGP